MLTKLLSRLILIYTALITLLLTVIFLFSSSADKEWIIYSRVSDCGYPNSLVQSPGDLVVVRPSGEIKHTIKLGCYDPSGLMLSRDRRYLLIQQPNALNVLNLRTWHVDKFDPFFGQAIYEWGGWSPDSKYIAFMAAPLQMPNYYDLFDLYLVSRTGAPVKKLTNRISVKHAPVWSPDGSQIAFIGLNANQEFDLFIINSDGTHLENITNTSMQDYNALFSPDGKYIFWSGYDSDKTVNLFKIELKSRHVQQLTSDDGRNFVVSEWSPDRNHLIYYQGLSTSRQSSLYLFDARNGESRFLTTGNTIGSGVDWSPDGTQVVYVKGNGQPLYAEICTFNLTSNLETCSGLYGHWLAEPFWIGAH